MNSPTPFAEHTDALPLQFALPDEMPSVWVGQENIKKRLAAALLRFEGSDTPLNPCLVGKPGMGKTSLAYHVGRDLFAQDVYIFQCTADTRPEDLLVSPVLGPDNAILYRASPVVTAMLRGGFCILDEANRMNEKAWASLAPLLDHRRSVHSQLLGTKYHAHPDFRIVATMNEDASTYALPEYVLSRLKPRLVIPFPGEAELEHIILRNFELCPRPYLEDVVRRMMQAHREENDWSLRDAISLTRYLFRLDNAGEPLDMEAAIGEVKGDARSQGTKRP